MSIASSSEDSNIKKALQDEAQRSFHKMSVIARLRGHTASVLCVKSLEDQNVVLTGGEDGRVCTFDLRSRDVIHRQQIATDGAAVPSLACHPQNNNKVHCCSGSTVHVLDTRKISDSARVSEFDYNSEEINSIAISARGTLLAAADDGGQTAIIDLAAASLFRLLKAGHSNICSSVAFREHSPWEVLTGGLDAQIIRWDFSSGKALKRWKLGKTADSGGMPMKACNPPFVHCVATIAAAQRPFGRIFAAACGDGSVAVYDADPPAKPRSSRDPGQVSTEPLVIDCTAHSSAVNSVLFLEQSDGGLVASGGNDGSIVIRDWRQNLPESSPFRGHCGDTLNDLPQSRLRIQHGRKINALEVAGIDRRQLLVSDVSRTVTLYNLE